MSFSRNLLKGLGLSEEQQTAVIEAYQSEVSAVREERDRYKSEAETKGKSLNDAQKELETLRQANTDADGWKAKYEETKQQFDSYKADTEAAAAKAAKDSAIAALLKDTFTADGAEKIRKYVDFSGAELTKDGTIKNSDKLLETLKADWPEHVKTTTTKGADIPNPPTAAAPKSGMTREEILKIEDTSERQKKIAENLAAFGVS